MARSLWCKRTLKDLKKLSPHIRIKRIRLGFFRVYYKGAYISEFEDEMGVNSYDINEYDPRLESQNYFEELEDHFSLVRQIKNFREGYYFCKDRLRTRLYMARNDKEFFENAFNAYKQAVIR